MIRYLPALFIITLFLSISCSEKKESIPPDTNPKTLETDFREWWDYHSKNIILSSDFIPVNENSKPISKDEFLKNLTSGEYIPLKLISNDSLTRYKLFKLNKDADKGIRGTVKNVSKRAYQYFKMEGTEFPEFSFTDLNGNTYTNENTKGKIIILKCWFISCKPCIAEFPKLNRLVKRFQNSKDILFISLAFDSKEKLETFLEQNPFEYAVIPDQKDFMETGLKINTYPTHFIIDENGVIQKVVTKADEMISVLENKKSIRNNPIKRPPPPPSSNR